MPSHCWNKEIDMAVIECAIAVGSFVGADALGAGAAALAGGAIMGAGAGALYSGITGDGNILNSALNGALIGGSLGFGGEALGLGSAAGATTPSAYMASAGLDAGTFGGVVAPTTGVGAPVAVGGIGASPELAAVSTPMEGAVLPNVSMTPNAYMQSAGLNPGSFAPGQFSTPGFWDSSMGSAAKWGAGILGANALLSKDNKKYGTFSQDQVTTNPLPYTSNYGTYKPLDTSVMRPMGEPAGYQGTSYGSPGYTGSRVGYAAGGIANAIPNTDGSGQMFDTNGVAQNQIYPQSTINSDAFSNATNTPIAQNIVSGVSDAAVDPYTGAQKFAGGGLLENIATMPIRQLQAAVNNPEQALIGANTPFETSMWNGLLGTNYTPTTNMWGTPTDQAVQENVSTHRPQYAAGGIAGHSSLGSYAAGGNPRLLKGPGDGMSDNIPATIGGAQPARLADGEFVVPADVVSHLGNGSTDAGADKLHSMMDKVRKARTGTKKQGKQIKADKFVPK
jgi:hypothetical protein